MELNHSFPLRPDNVFLNFFLLTGVRSVFQFVSFIFFLPPVPALVVPLPASSVSGLSALVREPFRQPVAGLHDSSGLPVLSNVKDRTNNIRILLSLTSFF